jgi:hypothetical protein
MTLVPARFLAGGTGRAHVLGTRLAASSGVAKRAFSFSLQWSATNAINEENAEQNTGAKETQRTLYGFRGGVRARQIIS